MLSRSLCIVLVVQGGAIALGFGLFSSTKEQLAVSAGGAVINAVFAVLDTNATNTANAQITAAAQK